MKSRIEEAAKNLCQVVQDNLKIDEKCQEAIETMINRILNADKIFIYGVGRSGLVGKAFAIRLVQLGLDIFFIGDSNTPMVNKDSAVIIISNTGQTMSAVQTANIVRRIGAHAISITSDPDSKLAHASSTIIIIAENISRNEKVREFAPLGTVFEQTATILLDSIVTVLMKKMGENEPSMKMRHAIWV